MNLADDADNAYRTVSAPVQFDERPAAPCRSPEYGQHTEEILLELGMGWDEIIAAKEAGAIL